MYEGPGLYEHYKGNRYLVIGLAVHTERVEETTVIYLPVEAVDLTIFYARPLWIFNQIVPWNGRDVRRFRRVESNLLRVASNLLGSVGPQDLLTRG